MDHSLFIKQSLAFKAELSKATTFNDIHKLWRETVIPYDMGNIAPYSENYKDIQLEIYKNLTGDIYNTSKEFTSTKQVMDKEFEIGYPWTTKNLEVIGEQLGKVAQAITAIGALQKEKQILDIVEFGSGWGNLAIPLAKSGNNVTCIDIDDGLLDRLIHVAKKEHCSISIIKGDFVESAKQIDTNHYDCAVFQSSFHHCLEFKELLLAIKNNVLNKNGVIYFFAEPIFENYSFPWGLRYDGESLWAIMYNSWLELGFDYNFFSDLLLKNGFFITLINGMGSLIGDGYVAVQSENGVFLKNWAMPTSFRETWQMNGVGSDITFSKNYSLLPGLEATSLKNKRYRMEIISYSLENISIEIRSGLETLQIQLPKGTSKVIEIPANSSIVSFEAGTFVPDILLKNGDVRSLGFGVEKIYAD